MAPAFVTGPSFTARTTFAGNAVPTCSKPASSAVTMSANTPSRREALVAGAALLAGMPLAALAKSGDSPKISVFGVGGASSPFDKGFQTGGKVLYKEYSEDEVAVFKRIFEEAQDRISGSVDAIKTKSWQDVRARIRLEAYELRNVFNKVNDSLADSDQKKAASKASGKFKNSLERLDQALVDKNQSEAFKKHALAVKDLAAWQTAVGF